MPEPKQESKNVIERVREQLAREGKERGHRTPRYRRHENGTEERIADGRQHITMLSSEVLELCALAAGNGKDDEIVQALEKGHKFAAQTPKGVGTNYADDIFHLLEAASGKIKEPKEHKEPKP